MSRLPISVADKANFRNRWLFSRMDTKIFELFFCWDYADIKASVLIAKINWTPRKTQENVAIRVWILQFKKIVS